MDYRLPYYMAYPTPFEYDDEQIERRDFEYMKSMYPDTVKRVLPYVEEECDRMEYEGSMIYDEYPDRLQLRLMCSRIYEKVKNDESVWQQMSVETFMEEPQINAQQRRNPGRDDRVRDIVEILLFQELMKRRNRHRRQRRFY